MTTTKDKAPNLDMTDPTVCVDLKLVHDECFFQWYHKEFLTGTARDPNPCQEHWEPYQRCVLGRLKAHHLDPKTPLKETKHI